MIAGENGPSVQQPDRSFYTALTEIRSRTAPRVRRRQATVDQPHLQKGDSGAFGGRIPAVSASHASAQPFQQFAGLRQRRVRIDPRGVFLAALPERRVVR